MYKVSELAGLRVLLPKKPKVAKDGTVTERLQRLGKVHNAVFAPNGLRVTGVMVKRPDVVGMIKREDAFVALDSLKLEDGCLVVTRPDDGMGEPARRRLGLNWDACIIWTGMDAVTTSGTKLGYCSDAAFDGKTGAVTSFTLTGGATAAALLGTVEMPASYLKAYRDGAMIVDDAAASLELSGGVAAKAGEVTAKASVKVKQGAKVLDEKGSVAVEKGSRALGRQLGKTRGMFSAFKDEFKKASAPSSAHGTSSKRSGGSAGTSKRSS